MEIFALLGILIVIGGGALWLAASDAAKRDARRADAPISGSDDGDGDVVRSAAVTVMAGVDVSPPCAGESSTWDSGSSTSCSSD